MAYLVTLIEALFILLWSGQLLSISVGLLANSYIYIFQHFHPSNDRGCNYDHFEATLIERVKEGDEAQLAERELYWQHHAIANFQGKWRQCHELKR